MYPADPIADGLFHSLVLGLRLAARSLAWATGVWEECGEHSPRANNQFGYAVTVARAAVGFLLDTARRFADLARVDVQPFFAWVDADDELGPVTRDVRSDPPDAADAAKLMGLQGAEVPDPDLVARQLLQVYVAMTTLELGTED